MKRLLLAVLFAMITILVLCATGSAELDAPQNVHWKEESTATATWDNVEGANYYSVIVHIYDHNNEIASIETGTDILEIDVQQEIHNSLQKSDYETVQVSFQVASVTIEADTINTGAFSGESAKIDYILKLPLASPQHLSLDDTGLLTWDNVEWAEWYQFSIHYEKNDVNLSSTGSSIHISETTLNGSIRSYDFSMLILDYYMHRCTNNQISLGDEVQVKIQLQAMPSQNDDSYRSRSEWSDWSNSITYSNSEDYSLATPVNLSLANEGLLTWDDVEWAEWYQFSIHYEKNGVNLSSTGSSIHISETTLNGSIRSYDFSTLILDYYMHRCTNNQISLGDEVQVKIQLQAMPSQNDDSYRSRSEWSDWSNSITYSNAEDYSLATPVNLSLADEGLLTWDDVEWAEWYQFSIHYEKNGVNLSSTGSSIHISETALNGSIRSYDFSTLILDYYMHRCTNNQIVLGDEVRVKIQLQAMPSQNDDSYHSRSEWSDWSNEILFSGRTVVSAISLAPEKPILYQGNQLYIGKTILPEDAFYTSIDWVSSDNSIASVNDVGLITGNHPGTATITATINDVIDSVDVTVYTITSNVEDEENKQEVTDTAGTIIDEIGNNDDPDLTNTDVDVSVVEELHDQIHEGIERGDTFCSDILISKRDWAHFKKYQNVIQQWLNNGVFIGGFNINIEIYHQDSSGNKYHIANITQFGNEIGFTIEGSALEENAPGQLKDLRMIRIHDGVLEVIPVTVNPDGSISGKSSKFSEFILINDSGVNFGTPTFTMPEQIRAIEESAFEGMTLMTIVDAKDCTAIGKNAFKSSGINQINLPANCQIDDTAFADCGLVYVFAPAGGSTETFCNKETNNCIFIERTTP